MNGNGCYRSLDDNAAAARAGTLTGGRESCDAAVLSDTHTVFYSLAPMKRPEDICRRHIFVKVGALDFMGILSKLK